MPHHGIVWQLTEYESVLLFVIFLLVVLRLPRAPFAIPGSSPSFQHSERSENRPIVPAAATDSQAVGTARPGPGPDSDSARPGGPLLLSS